MSYSFLQTPEQRTQNSMYQQDNYRNINNNLLVNKRILKNHHTVICPEEKNIIE